MEVEMRVFVLTLAGLMSLAAIAGEAAPIPLPDLTLVEPGVSRPLELIAQGCGYGFRRTRWQDQWGYWHWGRCVPKTWGNLSREQFSQ